MAEEQLFSLPQAMAAMAALRNELKLPEERFPLPALIGMLSDEIELMRSSGRSDTETADLLTKSIGVTISEDAVQRYYAPPERRRRG